MYDGYQFTAGPARYVIEHRGGGGLEPARAHALVQRLSRDQLARSSLVWWARRQSLGGLHSEQQLITDLLRDIASGRVRVRELERRSQSRYSHRFPDAEVIRRSSAPDDETPILDERSLMITRCDPTLGGGPLNFTYLLRGLSGHPVSLRITSQTFPGELVHGRALAPDETSDGSHDTQWNGVVSSPGKHCGKRLPSSFSPARVELVHDDIYHDAASFTITCPTVVIIDVGGFCFETDREVLLPDVLPLAHEEPGPVRVPAINATAAIMRFAVQHPDKSVFVAGHADTVGRDADNKVLSLARARNVQLHLAGDRAAWAEHCLDNYETEDQQRILAWVARTFPDYDCDPGLIDGDMGPITRGAQSHFRDHHAQQTGAMMPTGERLHAADWHAFAALYDRAIQMLLGDDFDLEAQRERLRFADPTHAGFGESFPSDRPDLDELDSERNRRVEVMFLDDAELELVADLSGEALYGEHADIVREHIPLGFGAKRDEIALRFVDELDQPIAGLALELEAPDGVLVPCTTNDVGETHVASLVRGTCRVRLTNVDAVNWESEDIAERQLPAPPPVADDCGYTEPQEDANGPIDYAALELVFDDDNDDD